MSMFVGLSLVITLTVNNSCDPEASGTINTSAIASSDEYAAFASVYVYAYSQLMPIITSLDPIDSVHFWVKMASFREDHDTCDLIDMTDILQDNTTLDIMEICQNVVEVGADLMAAFPALNLGTEEQFNEIAELGYNNYIWPEEFPWLPAVTMKSFNTTPRDSCLNACRKSYRWAKVGAIGWFTFEMCVGTLVCLVPTQQISSAAIVAVATGEYVKNAINIEDTYASCKAACPLN